MQVVFVESHLRIKIGHQLFFPMVRLSQKNVIVSFYEEDKSNFLTDLSVFYRMPFLL